MVKQFLLLMTFCASLTFAQSVQTDAGTNTESTTLSTQISTIANTLEQLKKITSSVTDTDSNIDELLAEMPVNTSNIDTHIDAFISKKEVVSTEQLQAINQLTDRIAKSKEILVANQQYILENTEKLTEQEEITESKTNQPKRITNGIAIQHND